MAFNEDGLAFCFGKAGRYGVAAGMVRRGMGYATALSGCAFMDGWAAYVLVERDEIMRVWNIYSNLMHGLPHKYDHVGA